MSSPQPGNRDEPEVEIVHRWMLDTRSVPEGRCPATECWYTLPLNAQGLVVQHSQSGTLSTCEGGGRPPRAAAADDQPGATSEPAFDLASRPDAPSSVAQPGAGGGAHGRADGMPDEWIDADWTYYS